MRLKLSRFRRNFNKDLPIEFTEQNLSSFGGLELFSRYLRRLELSRWVREALRGKGIRSDYGSVRLVLVMVGMLLVGARRQLLTVRIGPGEAAKIGSVDGTHARDEKAHAGVRILRERRKSI